MNYKHGMYGTRTYKSWSEMKARCNNPNHSRGNYNGINYCSKWNCFKNFFEDTGVRPDGTTLDRIDPSGDYCPENCRWADDLTQENNRRNNVFYIIGGERMTLSQIARKYKISRSNLANKVYICHKEMSDAVSYLLERKGC